MQLRVCNRTHDWWDCGHSGMEHRAGLVVILARHNDREAEVLDAVATTDMYEAADQFAAKGRLRREKPGGRPRILSHRAGPAEAAGLAGEPIRPRPGANV